MAWRVLTAEETVSRPEAQLQGSLLLIVVCTATLTLAAVIFLAFALLALPTALSDGRLGGMFASLFSGPSGVGLLYTVPMLYLVIWALVFTIMTFMRASATPGLAATGLAIWVGLRLVIGIAGQILLTARYSAGPAIILQSVLPTVLSIIGDVVLAVGFWVYMSEGARPNAYYRRRIRAG